ncbi:MAG TPA: acyl-CoA dehydrogenase family protein [Planctomycetota bacterium]|nr:acyl-CoA dehydrogenase family protein [Planctomycetota bacterium]
MDLNLSEEQEAARETAREFAEKKLMPIAAAHDAEERFPDEAIRELGELGLLGMMIPESHGGAALDAVSYALAIMEIARADASTAVILSVNNLVAETITQWGTAEQKGEFLPRLNSLDGLGAFALTEPHAGSDVQAIRTRAEKKGDSYILNGEKTWISNAASAGTFLVMAVTDPAKRTKGISAFIVDGKSKGLSVGKPEPKMGQRASHSCPVVFDNCRVPAENMLGDEGAGIKIALSALDSGRIGIASLSTGIIRACLEEMKKYSKERTAFGKPISEFQAVQWMIADTAVEYEAARGLSIFTAWRKQAGQPFSDKAAMAKLYASEAANRAAYRAVQVHGGYGYSREYRVERLYRDARVLTLYEGTSEIQRLVIARNVLKD